MDRREARAILESMKLIDFRVAPKSKAIEALELAIEALQEPTGDYEFFGGTYAKESDAESATTTDCISRQQAIEALTGWQTEPLDEDILRELNALPPVTPTEPKTISTLELAKLIRDDMDRRKKPTGKWIPKTGHREEIYVMPLICPECGVEVVTDHDNYCPNCGADMRGEEDD